LTLHTTRHCGNSLLAQRGVPAEIRARLGGWSVRGSKIQDGYTHLFIDHLRPYVTMLDEAVQEARQALDASKAAVEAVERVRADTLPAQRSGVDRHTATVCA
jgi:hypothetical protein